MRAMQAAAPAVLPAREGAVYGAREGKVASEEPRPAGEAEAAARRALCEKAYALAYHYEQTYGNCPQCVIAALQETFGGIDDAVFKAAHALAGGGALSTAGTCGALVGALLVVSSRYGRDRENFGKGRYLLNNQLAKRIFDRFVAEFGSPICSQVQTRLMGRSFDMWDAEDYKAFLAAGGHDDKCPAVSGKAALWVAELLAERGEQGNAP